MQYMIETPSTQRVPARRLNTGPAHTGNMAGSVSVHDENSLETTTARHTLENLHEDDHKKLKQVIDSDRKLYKIHWTDIFKPGTLFNKVLSRVLYPTTSTLIGKVIAAGDLVKMKEVSVPIKAYQIQTNDGHQLSVWFATNSNPEARTKIYFHGNASHIASFTQEAIEDYKQGNNVCLMSYRGYSGNSGYPSEVGLIDDTNSTLDFLIKKQGIGTESMDFIAHSLGSAVLLNSLAKRAESNPEERYGELLLMSPFKSIRAMVKTKIKIIPQFIISYLTNIWNNSDALAKLKNKISNLKILHGKADQLIPLKHSQDLYQEALKLGINAELIELDNIGHNDIRRDMQ